MQKLHLLGKIYESLAGYNSHSRIHRLNSFPDSNIRCFIKRDDELSFGISGSKIRKYLSLIPYLLNKKTEEAVIIGSAYSNHVLGLSQLLIENNIKPILFLLGDDKRPKIGNLLLTSLLVLKENIHWVGRLSWDEVWEIAQNYISSQHTKKIALIPEGACMPEALPGALTLALDIFRNEEQSGLDFDHIFLDSGTGLIAIATILAFAWLNKSSHFHVLQLADMPESFMTKLLKFQNFFEQLLDTKLESKLNNFSLYSPSIAPSFGATNETIFKYITDIARQEGFFTDPIFSAKLLYESKKIIQAKNLRGNGLIVHSGGALTLMGFQEQLGKFIY